ncbi:MAG: hypothetical protein ACR2HX_17685 [Pyrinomonadaceae bacterium]
MKRPLCTTPNLTLTRSRLVGPLMPIEVPKFPEPPVTPSPTELGAFDGLAASV